MPAVVSLCSPAMDTMPLTTSARSAGVMAAVSLKKPCGAGARSPAAFASSRREASAASRDRAPALGQILRSSYRPPQTLVVELIGGGARRPSGKIRADRNDGVLFLHILMNGVVGKASQGKAGAGKDGFDLVGGREAANAVEDISGFFFGQHSLFPVETRLAASRRASARSPKDGASPVSTNTPSRREYSGTAPDSRHVPCPRPAAAGPCRSLEFPTASTRRASRSRPSNSRTPS